MILLHLPDSFDEIMNHVMKMKSMSTKLRQYNDTFVAKPCIFQSTSEKRLDDHFSPITAAVHKTIHRIENQHHPTILSTIGETIILHE